jgi:hypothetical protein
MPDHAPSTNGPVAEECLPKKPPELPRGLLKPPQEVLDALAREKAKFPPGVFGGEFELRTLNEWTVDFVFGYKLGFLDEVLYPPTPEGPVVVAVGLVEILDLTKDMPLEEQLKLRTWVTGEYGGKAPS